ncbi:MAG: PRTRC system protein C [Terriglobia bacterium]
MTITPAQRIFSFAGIRLPDINRAMSPEEIKTAYERIRLVL